LNIKKIINTISLIIVLLSVYIVVGCTIFKKDEIPITTSSREALGLFTQGRDLYENLRTFESIDYFISAIEKDTKFAMAYYYLASAYRYTGSSNGFYRNLSKAIALVDKYLAFAHPYAGDTTDFYFTLRKAVSLADKVSEGERLIILGLDASVKGNFKKEGEIYEKLVKAYPEDKRAHFELGTFYYNQNNYSQAKNELEKAIEIDPKYAPAYNMLGYSYSMLSEYSKAEEVFKKYAELIPNEPNPYDSWGELLMKVGKFDESITAYKKVISIDPTFYNSYHGLGMNYVFKNKWEEGRKYFHKLFEIAPTAAQRRQALYFSMISYIDEGKLCKALEMLKRRYEIAKEIEDIMEIHRDLKMMGDIFLELGKLDEATEKYKEAVEILEKADVSDEIKVDAKQGLLYDEARIAIKLGDLTNVRSKAAAFYKQAAEEHNERKIRWYYELVGLISLEEEQYDDAIFELNRTDKNNPQNIYRIALAYEGKGEKEKAKELFIKAANFNEINYNYAFIRKKAQKKLSTYIQSK
jgi:tetratricopeptide (TPR) repeat protein